MNESVSGRVSTKSDSDAVPSVYSEIITNLPKMSVIKYSNDETNPAVALLTHSGSASTTDNSESIANDSFAEPLNHDTVLSSSSTLNDQECQYMHPANPSTNSVSTTPVSGPTFWTGDQSNGDSCPLSSSTTGECGNFLPSKNLSATDVLLSDDAPDPFKSEDILLNKSSVNEVNSEATVTKDSNDSPIGKLVSHQHQGERLKFNDGSKDRKRGRPQHSKNVSRKSPRDWSDGETQSIRRRDRGWPSDNFSRRTYGGISGSNDSSPSTGSSADNYSWRTHGHWSNDRSVERGGWSTDDFSRRPHSEWSHHVSPKRSGGGRIGDKLSNRSWSSSESSDQLRDGFSRKLGDSHSDNFHGSKGWSKFNNESFGNGGWPSDDFSETLGDSSRESENSLRRNRGNWSRDKYSGTQFSNPSRTPAALSKDKNIRMEEDSVDNVPKHHHFSTKRQTLPKEDFRHERLKNVKVSPTTESKLSGPGAASQAQISKKPVVRKGRTAPDLIKQGKDRSWIVHGFSRNELLTIVRYSCTDLLNLINGNLKRFIRTLNLLQRQKEKEFDLVMNIIYKLADCIEGSTGSEACIIIAEVLSERCPQFLLQLRLYSTSNFLNCRNCTCFPTRQFETILTTSLHNSMECRINSLCTFFHKVLETFPSTSWKVLPISDFTENIRMRKIVLSPDVHKAIESLELLYNESRELFNKLARHATNTKVSQQEQLWDNSEYRKISIFPSQVELCTPDRPAKLRPSIVNGSYKDWMHYYDVQLRLLREDFTAPLRRGICGYI